MRRDFTEPSVLVLADISLFPVFTCCNGCIVKPKVDKIQVKKLGLVSGLYRTVACGEIDGL